MTITEFLLARIEEDEVMAQSAAIYDGRWQKSNYDNQLLALTESDPAGDEAGVISHMAPTQEDADSLGVLMSDFAPMPVERFDHIARHDPARVLAECEAKRRIVTIWSAFLDSAPGWAERDIPSLLEQARLTLAALALPYADDPDYDEAWRM